MPIIHFSPGTNNGGGSLRRTSTTTVPLFLFHAITVISTTTVFTTTISNVNINSASINSSSIEGERIPFIGRTLLISTERVGISL